MLKIVLSFLATSIVLFVFLKPVGPLPALGKAFNPFTGIWRNGQVETFPRTETLAFEGLQKPVIVKWDSDHIPHIFAHTDADLYRAQGYVLARERLFQMDMVTRAGLGRLSELAGVRTLQIDQYLVRLGLRHGARQFLTTLEKNETTRNVADWFIAGVNQRIDELSTATLPIEYKLMDSRPEKWERIRIAGLLKIMSFNLVGRSQDVELSRLKKKWGREKIEDLFPTRPFDLTPIIPKETKWHFAAPDLPAPPEFDSVFEEIPETIKPAVNNGSNNWAVGPARSATGYSIVSNDTHLNYNLPNVWYEMQLITPELNVYGFTFPAGPGIVVGFNQKVAWAVTNATVDVSDWYEVKFKDSNRQEYWYEGAWRPTRIENEIIKVKGRGHEELHLVWTHHGVVVVDQNDRGLVYRWTAHEPSNEFATFYQLNRSQNIEDCHQALGSYQSPAQNFICADQDHISITQTGRFPIKYRGQGQFIMDGSLKANDWHGYIPYAQLPHVQDPAVGFVRSANQQATDEKYPYYMGWYYDDSYRARRISEFLASKNKLTARDFQNLQYDARDKQAEDAIPLLLKLLDRVQLTPPQVMAVKALEGWNFDMDPEEIAPSVYDRWMNNLQEGLWKEQLWWKTQKVNPHRSRTIKFLQTQGEAARDIVTQSFRKAYGDLTAQFGPWSDSWRWKNVNPINMLHIARIPGLGSKTYIMPGGATTPNANKGWHGAVLRMVVELGPTPKAWTIHSGGQTGNPMNPAYELFLERWSKGELKDTQFLTAKDFAQ